MDYKYIEQLLERYWNCETSLEEEQILRAFFQQKELPAHLLRYKSLFVYQEVAKEEKLGSDFDERILAEIERPVVRAKRLTMHSRFMPLFKAAAVLALLFTVGVSSRNHWVAVRLVWFMCTTSLKIGQPTRKWRTRPIRQESPSIRWWKNPV